MDMVSCYIQLGGDPGNVVVRDKFNPVSWPEVAVLQFLHGEESVYNIEYVSSEPATAISEKLRLIGIYGQTACDLVYPGRRPAMDGEFPGDKDETPMQPAVKSSKTLNPAPVKRAAPARPDTMVGAKQATQVNDMEEP